VLKRFALVAIGATIAILAVVAPAPRLDAAPACTATSGVTVIVDFTHFGRPVERGCAPGHPATALAALQSAGFTTAGTANYGDAFLCRIDGLPLPKAEACTVTPPATSSWSFYFARAADSDWIYSTAGVSSYQPHAGTIIAFAFGNHTKPGVRPSGVIVAGTTTTTSTMPIPPSSVAPASPPASAQATVKPVTSTSATLPSSTTSPPPGPTAPTTGPVPASTSTTAPLVVDRKLTGSAHPGSGSAIPALVTVALVAVLGAGAAVMIRARRRRAA
jgi:hypothetical protein